MTRPLRPFRRLRVVALAASLGVAGGLAATTLPAHATSAPVAPLLTTQNTNGYPVCVAVTWLNWGDCITVFQG